MKKIALSVFVSILWVSCYDAQDCEKSKRCYLLPDAELRKAYFPKYYFDRTERKCKEFILAWRGNRVVPFETLEEGKRCECSKSK